MVIAPDILSLLAAVVCYDLTQRRHAILHNFPLIGHFRYLFKAVGPELRQYMSNTELFAEAPLGQSERVDGARQRAFPATAGGLHLPST